MFYEIMLFFCVIEFVLIGFVLSEISFTLKKVLKQMEESEKNISHIL